VIPLPQMLTPPAGAAAQNGSYQNVILDIQRELEDEPEEQPQTGFAATIGAAVTGFRQRALSSSIVLGVVTMLLIAWGVAGAKKRGSPEWVSQATLAKSPPTDSTRIGGTTETLGRPLGVDFGTKAAADSVPTLESRPGPARNSIIIESSSSPGPVTPVVVIPSISLQAQSRIDSAIHAADAPRQTAA